MTRGRKPKPGTRHKMLYLSEALMAQVELYLPFDAARGTPRYGTWSGLVEQLLRDWVEKENQIRQQRKDTLPQCQSTQ